MSLQNQNLPRTSCLCLVFVILSDVSSTRLAVISRDRFFKGNLDKERVYARAMPNNHLECRCIRTVRTVDGSLGPYRGSQTAPFSIFSLRSPCNSFMMVSFISFPFRWLNNMFLRLAQIFVCVVIHVPRYACMCLRLVVLLASLVAGFEPNKSCTIMISSNCVESWLKST